MTKADIVDVISEGTGLTKVETQAVIDGLFATVSYALRNGDRVELRGFGNFKRVKRKARIARNPISKEPIEVPEHFAAVFRPSKDLKKYVNEEVKEDILE